VAHASCTNCGEPEIDAASSVGAISVLLGALALVANGAGGEIPPNKLVGLVHIVTSSNLRCAKMLAELLHSVSRTEIRDTVAPWATPASPKITQLG
jgi:hypothetical protein